MEKEMDESRALTLMLLKTAQPTLKGKTFNLYIPAREQGKQGKGKTVKLRIGFIGHRTGNAQYPINHNIEHLKPTLETMESRRALYEKFEELEKEPSPIIQVLKLEQFKPKFSTRVKRLIYSYVYEGGARIRRARYSDNQPPDFKTFNCKDGKMYKFYFKCTFTNRTRVKKLKSNANMDKRKILSTTISRGEGFTAINEKWIVYKVIEIDRATLKEKIIYEIRTASRTTETRIKQITLKKKSHAYKRIIDYNALMKYYPKMSQGWRLRLLNSIYNKNPPTTPNLRRIYFKVVKKVKVSPRAQIEVKQQ